MLGTALHRQCHARQRNLQQIKSTLVVGYTLFFLSLLTCTQAVEFPVPGGIYVASFEENTPVSGSIVTVGCTDSAGIPLTTATYSIVNDTSRLFTIDASSGLISWSSNNQILDYETATFYLFTVGCSDNLVPPSTATASVRVSVLPVNEYVPVFDRNFIFVTAAENAPMNTVLVSTRPGGLAQYTVTDRDAGPDGVIRFSLSNTTSQAIQQLFTVNPVDGTLSPSGELEVDNLLTGRDILTVRITACDTAPPRAECPTAVISIIIESAADNDPMFATNQIAVTFSENTPVGTVLATSMCTDMDTGQGEYEGIDIFNIIPSDSAETFQLDSDSEGNGVLLLASSLDYESVRLYNMTIRCFDNLREPTMDLASVYIMVRPINDEPPIFQFTFYSFAVNRISASGVDIGQVVAIDNDLDVGGEISYSIISGDETNFGVRPDGMVYLKDFVFAFEGESFELIVMASDGTFNSTTQVIITVSGFLSIPEIVVILISAVVFILVIVIVVVIVCICCCKCLPSNEKSPSFSDLKHDLGEGQHQLDYIEPATMMQAPPVMMVPVQYEPVQSRAPHSLFQNWAAGSQESPSESENGDEVDQGSVPQSSGIGPVLHEVVEHFKEGDKLISKGKKDKDKSEK